MAKKTAKERIKHALEARGYEFGTVIPSRTNADYLTVIYSYRSDAAEGEVFAGIELRTLENMLRGIRRLPRIGGASG